MGSALPRIVGPAAGGRGGLSGGLASPRPPGANAERLAAAATGLQAALTGLMEAERARLAVADAASVALGAQAAERPPDGFDLHLRIGPPA